MINIKVFQLNDKSFWICPMCKEVKKGNLKDKGYMGCHHITTDDFIYNPNKHNKTIINLNNKDNLIPSLKCEEEPSVTNDIMEHFLNKLTSSV